MERGSSPSFRRRPESSDLKDGIGCLYNYGLISNLREVRYDRQKEISLKYKGKDIGKHRVDYLVEGEVIVELKAVESLHKIYEAQVLT